MYATKEAILVREHHPECAVHILYMDLRVFGKRFQEFVTRAREVWGVDYVNGRAAAIMEDQLTQNLLVRYENVSECKIEEMWADVVVLCPALIPREDTKVLAKALGIEQDTDGFFKVKDPLLMPVETNVDGIFVCGYCQSPKDISESVTQASAAASKAAEVATAPRPR